MQTNLGAVYPNVIDKVIKMLKGYDLEGRVTFGFTTLKDSNGDDFNWIYCEYDNLEPDNEYLIDMYVGMISGYATAQHDIGNTPYFK